MNRWHFYSQAYSARSIKVWFCLCAYVFLCTWTFPSFSIKTTKLQLLQCYYMDGCHTVAMWFLKCLRQFLWRCFAVAEWVARTLLGGFFRVVSYGSDDMISWSLDISCLPFLKKIWGSFSLVSFFRQKIYTNLTS